MKIKLLLYCCILLICFGCKSYKTKYPYSLEDFRPELRGDLQKIIQNGVAESYGSERLEENCNINDLHKMFKCEHPLIRAFAFKSLLEKDSNNIKELLLSSLDDTAIISVDHGEWGIPRMYCSDYYLSEFRNTYRLNTKNNLSENDLIDILIEKHTYLQNTYSILNGEDSLQEKHYYKIEKMANETISKGIFMGNGTPYISKEYGKMDQILHILSKYKKQEDISFIKENLRYSNPYYWKIIQDNPDTAYFSIIENFYEGLKRAKNASPTQLQVYIYGGRRNFNKEFDDFLLATVLYKTSRSAKILGDIIESELIPYFFNAKGNHYRHKVMIYELIKDNYCKEYYSLLQKLKPMAENYLNKNSSTLSR